MSNHRTILWPTTFFLEDSTEELDDPITVEEPLEIRLAQKGRETIPFTMTMRTPGDDPELVLGLLYSEGIIDHRSDVESLASGDNGEGPPENRITVSLDPAIQIDDTRVARTFVSNSACGICGKTSIDSIFVQRIPRLPEGPRISPNLLGSLPQRMHQSQETFHKTGGIHAAALFDTKGRIVVVREDVGRHNAVDKLVGNLLLQGHHQAHEYILVTSGRVGFEIAQKALRAGIPILAAVGAPTQLSLKLAERGGMTIVGFLRHDRLNIYTHPARVG